MKINHITILVKDNKAAADYYSRVLEMGDVKRIDGKHYWIQIGDIYLHLAANSGEPIKNTFYHFAVEVENLPDYLQKLNAKEIEVTRHNQQFFIKDLDGNLIELVDSANQFFK